MNPKYKITDAVKTPMGAGIITDLAKFSDHVEYLVELPDKTASWFHESKLSAATLAAE